MQETIRMGRIAGVRVGANWSLLVIAGLLAWALTSGFSVRYPGHGEVTYWLAGVVSVVVLYATLLTHELGHALTARRQGLGVEGITLWLLGGVTRMREEAVSPAHALRVALAGPAVSLAAAGIFGLLAFGLEGVAAPALLEGIAWWLARANLVLAAFNLVPAAPLDGGRVLQALLWRRTGDRRAASVTAARAGRAFGFLLVGAGLLDLFTGIGLGGLWFILLGWFLLTAAKAEQATTEARSRLEGVRVGEVMSGDLVVVPGWVTIEAFLDGYVRRYGLAVYPVDNFDGSPVGWVTLDTVERVPLQDRTTIRVADVAVGTEGVPVARAVELVLDVLERMEPPASGHALVVDDGRVVGMVSAHDLGRALKGGCRPKGFPRPSGGRALKATGRGLGPGQEGFSNNA